MDHCFLLPNLGATGWTTHPPAPQNGQSNFCTGSIGVKGYEEAEPRAAPWGLVGVVRGAGERGADTEPRRGRTSARAPGKASATRPHRVRARAGAAAPRPPAKGPGQTQRARARVDHQEPSPWGMSHVTPAQGARSPARARTYSYVHLEKGTFPQETALFAGRRPRRTLQGGDEGSCSGVQVDPSGLDTGAPIPAQGKRPQGRGASHG